ncbi:MAG: hypothetical protein RL112_529 [Planctomycetota bacterium]
MNHPLSSCLSLALVCAAFTARATAQGQGRLVVSIEWQSATVGQLDGSGTIPITEGDLLTPTTQGFGPLPRMTIAVPGSLLGLPNYASCSGHASGTPCGIEIDAHSRGNEALFRPAGVQGTRPRLYYSVDEYARGVAGGSPVQNALHAEALLFEAAADVYTTRNLLFGPLQPGAFTPGTLLVLDGNGLPGSAGSTGLRQRGLGLVEPIQPGGPADAGDNLDTLSMTLLGPLGAEYYSLDGSIPDPLNGIAGSNTAQTLGVSPSAVLRRLATGSPSVYATASQLGLDREGFATDDLDALILVDDGDGVFEPSQVPNDWVATGGAQVGDMLLFSVRRGSRVVGRTDSLFGAPIEPGDILTTPINGVGRPAIYIPAEALGLRTTRSGAPQADDLDAFALVGEPWWDCNENGVEDSVDISQGGSSDNNGNFIPDECEDEYAKSCFCTAGAGPCGNDNPSGGCLNSLGVGGALDPSGSTSLVEDDLVLTASNLPPNVPALLFCGPNATFTPFGDGRRCVGNPLYRLGSSTANSSGVLVRGPGLAVQGCATPGLGCLSIGQALRFQLWYRNAANYCTPSSFNLTNAVDVVFTP